MADIKEAVTICVGTVRRPYCIQRFITSVRANFPDIPIIVGDQDPQNTSLHAFYEAASVETVYVLDDAGVSVARNAAVARVATEYILLCDDDFIFSSETRLEHPLLILKEDPAIDIVGGAVRDLVDALDAPVAKLRRWEHFFTLDRKNRILLSTPIDAFQPRRKELAGIPYFLADVVLNWKLMRRSAFEKGAAWDPQFKCNGEHSDFYLNLKENTQLRVAYCPSFIVYHHSPVDYSYRAKRDDPDGFRRFGTKWGIDEVLDVSDDQPRMILADNWTATPQAKTAAPEWQKSGTLIPIDKATSAGPLDPKTWPASPFIDGTLPPPGDLRVSAPFNAAGMRASTGGLISLRVTVENRSAERIGCLGTRAPALGYNLWRNGVEVGAKHRTPLCYDLFVGLTFHFINIIVDWDADQGEMFELEIDLFSFRGEAVACGVRLMIEVTTPTHPTLPRGTIDGCLVDFSKPEMPDFLLLTFGLSFVESWGRWSDANIAAGVTLRFFDPLPLKMQVKLTCLAFGPNVNQPVRVEIGRATNTFLPTSTELTYDLDFSLDGEQRTIRIYPPYPTSPTSLGQSVDDNRRIGIGLVKLSIIGGHQQTSGESIPHHSGTSSSSREETIWETAYIKEDPRDYGNVYEQSEYASTLELLPERRIGSALEIGCAEGLFTEMLAPRVDRLLGLDISETALARARDRCAGFSHVSFAFIDIAETFPEEHFDLIVCSEVLYYLQDIDAFRIFVGRIVNCLARGGLLLMAHANSVSDDPSTTGFDFSEVGAVFIGEMFAETPILEFLKELRTPLYRVQMFRMRDETRADYTGLTSSRLPREVVERSASFTHPQIRWGGCVITSAQARHCYETLQVPILMYHRIAADGPSGLSRYRVDPTTFERQLAYLQRYGYATARVDDIWSSYAGSDARRPGKWVALTFDDAYEDFAEVAWPILQKFGFSATVFVPTAHVGGQADWDREYGEPAPLMGWDTIRRLAAEGVVFGSHAASHRNLTELSQEDSAKEIRESMEEMRTRTGSIPKGFCFPYTSMNPEVRDLVRDTGYEYAVAGDVIIAQVGRFALPRIEVRGDMDFDAFIASLPEPMISSEGRRAAYHQMRAVRHRATYFPFDSPGRG